MRTIIFKSTLCRSGQCVPMWPIMTEVLRVFFRLSAVMCNGCSLKQPLGHEGSSTPISFFQGHADCGTTRCSRSRKPRFFFYRYHRKDAIIVSFRTFLPRKLHRCEVFFYMSSGHSHDTFKIVCSNSMERKPHFS